MRVRACLCVRSVRLMTRSRGNSQETSQAQKRVCDQPEATPMISACPCSSHRTSANNEPCQQVKGEIIMKLQWMNPEFKKKQTKKHGNLCCWRFAAVVRLPMKGPWLGPIPPSTHCPSLGYPEHQERADDCGYWHKLLSLYTLCDLYTVAPSRPSWCKSMQNSLE